MARSILDNKKALIEVNRMLVVWRDFGDNVELDENMFDRVNEVQRKGDEEALAYIRYYLENGDRRHVLTLDAKIDLNDEITVLPNGRSLGFVAITKAPGATRELEGYDERGEPVRLYYDALTKKHLIAVSIDLPTYAKVVRLIISSAIVLEADVEERIASVYFLFRTALLWGSKSPAPPRVSNRI